MKTPILKTGLGSALVREKEDMYRSPTEYSVFSISLVHDRS